MQCMLPSICLCSNQSTILQGSFIQTNRMSYGYNAAMGRTRYHWKQLPASIRKPLVLVIGSLFILAAAATGWLPGPGGIPLFLVGIAILATEFVWAERFRDLILAIIKRIATWYKAHKIIGSILLLCCIAFAAWTAYSFFSRL
jgi:small-conductance mechanosensitive channel